MTEYVLVFPRDIVSGLPEKAFYSDPDLLNHLLANMKFMERSLAEHDYAYKQFITYSILRYEESLVRYRRNSGGRESRLHGLYSIGWGGHVNSTDDVLPLWDNAIISQTALRELQEEINITSFKSSCLVGFINDDSNDVGRVHFGIVYEYWLDDPSFGRKYKQGHEKISLVKISELISHLDDYEGWSQILILDYLQSENSNR